MKRLFAANVRVNESGDATITSPGRAPAAASGATESGPEAVGQLLCEALGIPVSEHDQVRAPIKPAHVDDPVVEVAMHALAIGALGRTISTAGVRFREQVGSLAHPARLAASREELGDAVQEILRAPAGQPATAPAAHAPAAPKRAGSSRWRLPLAIAGALVIATSLTSLLVIGLPRGERPAAKSIAQAPPPSEPATVAAATPVEIAPTATPAPPTPASPPVPAPPSAGRVRGVDLQTTSACAIGRSCGVRVDVRFLSTSSPTSLAWTIRFYDSCTGNTSSSVPGRMDAPAGWNTIVAYSSIAIPSTAHRGWLIAVSSDPAAAASRPIEIAGSAC
jgi:hypothetical protein